MGLITDFVFAGKFGLNHYRPVSPVFSSTPTTRIIRLRRILTVMFFMNFVT
jgi:hypothetical protein